MCTRCRVPLLDETGIARQLKLFDQIEEITTNQQTASGEYCDIYR